MACRRIFFSPFFYGLRHDLADDGRKEKKEQEGPDKMGGRQRGRGEWFLFFIEVKDVTRHEEILDIRVVRRYIHLYKEGRLVLVRLATHRHAFHISIVKEGEEGEPMGGEPRDESEIEQKGRLSVLRAEHCNSNTDPTMWKKVERPAMKRHRNPSDDDQTFLSFLLLPSLLSVFFSSSCRRIKKVHFDCKERYWDSG